MKRKGYGHGKGRGYKNLMPKDPKVHKDSAKGRKQPQELMNNFQKIIADADRRQLQEMQEELNKEIRLSDTAIEEGFEKETRKVKGMSEKAVVGKLCFNCGKRFKKGDDWYYWYHGDQDDRVCGQCAVKLKHMDTEYAGMPVGEYE